MSRYRIRLFSCIRDTQWLNSQFKTVIFTEFLKLIVIQKPLTFSRNSDLLLYEFQNVFSLQYNLVCDDAHFRVMADSLFMVGALLGSIIFGGLSDR